MCILSKRGMMIESMFLNKKRNMKGNTFQVKHVNLNKLREHFYRP